MEIYGTIHFRLILPHFPGFQQEPLPAPVCSRSSECNGCPYLKGSCSGRKNRVGGTELERTLHVSGTDLRKLVNQLRRKTHPIASDRNGYFYATTAGEVYDTIRQLKRMAAGLEAAINGLERSMDRFREDEEAGHG